MDKREQVETVTRHHVQLRVVANERLLLLLT